MGTILMSDHERRRLEVFSRVVRNELTLTQAAENLKISYRQAKRIKARYVAEGDAGLVHRSRGKASGRRTDAAFRDQVLTVVATKYADFGPTLAAEYLEEQDGLKVPVSTLRRWLFEEGMLPKRRRRKEHRRHRERKQHAGELVQMDGSIHAWFEDRGPEAVLMVAIDDATGQVEALFFEAETTVAAMTTFRHYTERRGLPHAIYVDQSGIYRPEREPTGEEIVAGIEPKTQFGRAMEQLGVRLILARSPQAKGRVERMNGTLQDRLIKAMRLAGISDIASANAFLEEFLPKFNAKFGKPPRKKKDLHRASPSKETLDLALSIRETRSVQNDWTVRWQNRFLQLPRSLAQQIAPRDRVEVVEQLDGRVRLFRGGRELAFEFVSSPPIRWPRKRKRRAGPIRSNQGQRPAKDHPWRKPFLSKKSKAS